MVWTELKLSGWEQGPVAGWCGQGKVYLDENRDQCQDVMDKAKVIWLRTGTNGRMMWTG